MDELRETHREISRKEYELGEKKSELEQAKDAYRVALMNEAITNIMRVLNEEGKLTERDLEIFLRDLSIKTKQLYSK